MSRDGEASHRETKITDRMCLWSGGVSPPLPLTRSPALSCHEILDAPLYRVTRKIRCKIP
jgi:hypothetical protein